MKEPGLIEPDIYQDNRGYYMPLFKDAVGVNMSFSKFGTIRGMHFQRGAYSQNKLVHVLDGTINDVILNLDDTSEVRQYYLRKGDTLFVPENYAHGFCATSEARIIYAVDNIYYPPSEGIIRWDSIGYDWHNNDPIMSEKDRNAPTLEDYLLGGRK